MKLMDYVFAAMLAVIAALQFNDPDPVYWVAVYGLAALVPLAQAFGGRAPFLAALTMGMIVSGMIYASGGFFDYLQAGKYASITGPMGRGARYVEPAREFLGLLIALLVVGYYALRWHRN